MYFLSNTNSRPVHFPKSKISIIMNQFSILVIVAIFALVPAKLFSQSVVQGIVYEDLNRNGKMDRNEKGVPDVAVSNGKDVVKTNSKGEYALTISDDNIIFVSKPSAYSLPLNEYRQPQFYYIHKPKGSPKLKFAGTPPTGELPPSVNFPLIPVTQKNNFKILVFGDPQPYTQKEVDYFYQGIVKEVEN